MTPACLLARRAAPPVVVRVCSGRAGPPHATAGPCPDQFSHSYRSGRSRTAGGCVAGAGTGSQAENQLRAGRGAGCFHSRTGVPPTVFSVRRTPQLELPESIVDDAATPSRDVDFHTAWVSALDKRVVSRPLPAFSSHLIINTERLAQLGQPNRLGQGRHGPQAVKFRQHPGVLGVIGTVAGDDDQMGSVALLHQP